MSVPACPIADPRDGAAGAPSGTPAAGDFAGRAAAIDKAGRLTASPCGDAPETPPPALPLVWPGEDREEASCDGPPPGSPQGACAGDGLVAREAAVPPGVPGPGAEAGRPGLLRRLARGAAFARHVPPRQLLRRLWLVARRNLQDRAGGAPFSLPPAGLVPVLTVSARSRLVLSRLVRFWSARPLPAVPPLAACPPQPLLPPAPGGPVREGGGLRFRFLARDHFMPAGLDWSAPGDGPAFQLWRMTLHDMAWCEGVDDALFVHAVESWIATFGTMPRGSWRDAWNGYALSIRVVAWMGGIARRGRMPAGAAQSLARQLCHLEGALETDIGGNHLVRNVRALLWGSAFFAGPVAARWRASGLRLLETVLRTQIPADGMHFERSPSYHCQVFADLLDCAHVLGSDAPPALGAALRRMAQAAADMTHPDGGVALFNDGGLDRFPDPAACLAAFARLFGAAPAPRPVFALEQAGYFGWRAGGTCLLADCGRIAPDALPAHGHGDVLSFEWSVGGRRIVVDPGVCEYVAGARRQASRSAASHNTLCFEGADQADFFGAFRCGRRPSPRLLAFAGDAGGATLAGTHDGFARLPGRPAHTRRFRATPGGLVVADTISGRPDRAAVIGVLLHPAVSVRATAGGLMLAVAEVRIGVRIAGGTVAVRPAAWWPAMGCERPAWRIEVRAEPGTAAVTMTFEILAPELPVPEPSAPERPAPERPMPERPAPETAP